MTTNTTPSGADALQEGNTVYVLNARGSNRWWASVQPGQDDEGKRTSDDECKQIAHAIRAALSAAQEAPTEEVEALNDMLSDARLQLDMLREALGVKIEPHQSLFERMMDAARGAQWVDLTDDDRERAFRSMPDMLDGFLKKWGWLHFAKAIEAICREKNANRAAQKGASNG